jgi:hypothetical protein
MIWFPTSHAIVTPSQEFLHCKADVAKAASGTDLVAKDSITRKELVDLSSQIVNLCEEGECQKHESDDLEKLAWLFANALRVGEFDRIKIVRVGRLASSESVTRTSVPPLLI